MVRQVFAFLRRPAHRVWERNFPMEYLPSGELLFRHFLLRARKNGISGVLDFGGRCPSNMLYIQCWNQNSSSSCSKHFWSKEWWSPGWFWSSGRVFLPRSWAHQHLLVRLWICFPLEITPTQLATFISDSKPEILYLEMNYHIVRCRVSELSRPNSPDLKSLSWPSTLNSRVAIGFPLLHQVLPLCF